MDTEIKEREIPKKVQYIQTNTQESPYRWDDGRGNPTGEVIAYSGFMNVIGDDQHVLTPDLVKYYNMLYGSEHLVIEKETDTVKTKDGIVIGVLGEMVQTRYVANSTEIWKAVQEKRNIKPTALLSKTHPPDRPIPGDEVFIQDGNVWVDVKTKKKDKGLWLWLNMHNQNESFPYRDDSIAFPIFKMNDPRRNAISELEREDVREQARMIIWKLRDGKSFDKDQLAFYKRLFSREFGSLDNPEEIFLALIQKAYQNPEAIINTIETGRAEYEATVHGCFEFGILAYGRGNVVNTKTNNVLVTIGGRMTEGDKREKIINFLISKDGDVEFEYLKKALDVHKNNT